MTRITKEQRDAELKPCPFCGAGQTSIDEQNHWTGMRNELLSVTLRHWCAAADDQFERKSITIRARTEAEAIAAWNRRALLDEIEGAEKGEAEPVAFIIHETDVHGRDHWFVDASDYAANVEAMISGVRRTPLYAVPVTAKVTEEMDAAHDVLAERARQVAEKGWTAEHDDQHANEELARAAACYARPDDMSFTDSFGRSLDSEGNHRPFSTDEKRRSWSYSRALRWPWERRWWKPGDRRRMLVKAGALILAEIERLDRQAALSHKGGGNAA